MVFQSFNGPHEHPDSLQYIKHRILGSRGWVATYFTRRGHRSSSCVSRRRRISDALTVAVSCNISPVNRRQYHAHPLPNIVVQESGMDLWISLFTPASIDTNQNEPLIESKKQMNIRLLLKNTYFMAYSQMLIHTDHFLFCYHVPS